MILTGKAKEDFVEWCKQDADWLQTYEDIFLYALIIEWFDSVGIYVECNRATLGIDFKCWYYTISDSRGVHLNNYLYNIVKVDSRHEATKQAIIKANELYNENNPK